MKTRLEHDLLGEMEIPVDAYYGIHSQRAKSNFNILMQPIHPQLIKALAEVKKACALVNNKTGRLDAELLGFITSACDEVISGKYNLEFITDAFQGGAGTSANMNANEVIANIALEAMGYNKGDYYHCHPLDHINLSQSTNDVFPTAVKIAAIRLLLEASEAMNNLQKSLQDKEREFADVVKVGRTEMQDAVPITLGQEFSAYAQAVWRDWWRLYKVEERLRQVNLGGTAIGTGLNADKRYVFTVVDILRETTGLSLARAENMIDVTQNCDMFVEVSGLLKSAAVNLHKLASDLRLLSSGPDAGFGEISLPSLQAGSSIMPGKVNPVITEAVSQAAFQIMSNDQAITLAAMSGQLELNPYIPSIAHNLFQSLELLKNAANSLSSLCIEGISVNTQRCRYLLEHSMVMLTALSPYIGYEKSSQIAQKSRQSGKTIRQIVLEMELFEAEQLDYILSAQQMTKPGIAGKD